MAKTWMTSRLAGPERERKMELYEWIYSGFIVSAYCTSYKRWATQETKDDSRWGCTKLRDGRRKGTWRNREMEEMEMTLKKKKEKKSKRTKMCRDTMIGVIDTFCCCKNLIVIHVTKRKM